MNDAILSVCRLLAVESWDDLGPGFRSYMSQQMARRLHRAVAPIVGAKSVGEKEEQRLRRVVEECAEGLGRPAAWDHHPQFGLLTSGDTAPERIGNTLLRFSSEGRDFFEDLDRAGAGREAFLRSLSELIEARHTAAHALPERADPGPRDAQAWIVSSFWLVRRIDSFLEWEIFLNAAGSPSVA